MTNIIVCRRVASLSEYYLSQHSAHFTTREAVEPSISADVVIVKAI